MSEYDLRKHRWERLRKNFHSAATFRWFGGFPVFGPRTAMVAVIGLIMLLPFFLLVAFVSLIGMIVSTAVLKRFN